MLRFRMMKSTVVMFLRKVFLFRHLQKAQILGVFVMIGREPESAVIEDRPYNPRCDFPGKHPEPLARFILPFTANCWRRGKCLDDRFRNFAK